MATCWPGSKPERRAQRNPGRDLGHGNRLWRRHRRLQPVRGTGARWPMTGRAPDYARPEFLAALKLYQQQHYPLQRDGGELGRRLRPDPVHAHRPSSNMPPTAMATARSICGLRAPDALASSARAAGRARLADRASPGAMRSSCPTNFAYEDADLDTQKTIVGLGGAWA